MISFEEATTLGRGNYIKVNTIVKVAPNHPQYKKLKGKPVLATLGRIDTSSNGKFYYYEPEANILNPTFIEDNLDRLKEKIKAHVNQR